MVLNPPKVPRSISLEKEVVNESMLVKNMMSHIDAEASSGVMATGVLQAMLAKITVLTAKSIVENIS